MEDREYTDDVEATHDAMIEVRMTDDRGQAHLVFLEIDSAADLAAKIRAALEEMPQPATVADDDPDEIETDTNDDDLEF
jgi:hypothetical protein